MIRLIAMDMDGTLLNGDHIISQNTIDAIKEGIQHGIRFIICTGRYYIDASRLLQDLPFRFDYITCSGADVWDKDGRLLKQITMPASDYVEINRRLVKFPVAISYYTSDTMYMIGTQEEITEYLITEHQSFFTSASREEILQSELFHTRKQSIHCIQDIGRLKDMNVPIIKIFIFSYHDYLIADINKALEGMTSIALASSFANNVELTHIAAQKGNTLKEYALSNGYQMEEVMAIGDSMNDYSMLSMPFGATIAMENAVPALKRVSRYLTLSNLNDGVAHAIHKTLSNSLADLTNPYYISS